MPGVMPGIRPRLGIDAEDISGQLGAYFGAPDGEGILVRNVNPGSAAEKAGVKAGDVITSFNGERLRSLGDLRQKLRPERRQAGETGRAPQQEQCNPDRGAPRSEKQSPLTNFRTAPKSDVRCPSARTTRATIFLPLASTSPCIVIPEAAAMMAAEGFHQ